MAQDTGSMQVILDRLDRLEQQNRELLTEIRSLKAEVAARTAPQPPTEAPPIDETVAVQERRIEDLAQTKVEGAQKFPITLNGMLLFNTFLNGRASSGNQYPTTAALTDAPPFNGGSLRQTIIGLSYRGPEIWGGGKISGNLSMDFFSGRGYLNQTFRIRVGTVDFDWKNTSIHVGQDKPIIAPRDPYSLAQVGISPLTGAGNLWLWQPQLRVEQRIGIGANSGLNARVGVYQSNEPAEGVADAFVPAQSLARPALEGRFEFWRALGKDARIEIAPGFHVGTSRVAGINIPSRLFTVDWLIRPLAKWEITGTYFQGQNAAGVGGLRQGFIFTRPDRYNAIHAAGGWTQLSFAPTARLTFRAMGGQESNRGADLVAGRISRNLTYAGNATYQVRSNILLGIEAAQIRTMYFLRSLRMTNHYDLSLAYLF